MWLTFVCPNCGARERLLDKMAGKRIRCGNCRVVNTVDEPDAPEPESKGGWSFPAVGTIGIVGIVLFLLGTALAIRSLQLRASLAADEEVRNTVAMRGRLNLGTIGGVTAIGGLALLAAGALTTGTARLTCPHCSGVMVKKTLSTGNCLGILVALVVLASGIMMTLFIPVIGWVLGPLICLVGLFMGGKRQKVWRCKSCRFIIPRG